MSQTTNTITDPNDLREITPVQRWQAEIEAAEKELKKFHERATVVNRRFLDERDMLDQSHKWFNIFFANVQILESALYAQLPRPVVSRRYMDFNDDVGRVAAMMLQRAISEDLDDPNDTFDGVMRHAVQDRLVPGLATAWLRLETEFENLTPPPEPGMGEAEEVLEEQLGEIEEEGSTQRIADQKICLDYVHWKDFIWSPCRVWEERRWVARKVYMSRPELIKRFGERLGAATPLDYHVVDRGVNVQSTTPNDDVLKKAIVYEIWDRENREVLWYSKGMQELLDTKEDFLKLRGFEPCPRPMLANTSTSNTVPRPDYYMIRDQYTELDTVNNRISMLVQACKVVGTYDKSAIGVSRMLTEGFDNQLIPVDNWAMFAEKGGIKGAIDWLPLEQVTQALQQLNQAREAIKGQIYELTGIADIVRGASKASETLGAQQIKAQFASVRIKKLQDETARFASDIMRIKAEIMVKHFEPELIIKKANMMATPDMELVPQAMALLKEPLEFEWRVEVNADTLAQADYAAEREDRMNFMGVMSKFMQQFGPMVQSAPASAPLLLTLLKWSVSSFRNAQDIEGLLDRELDRMVQEAKQPKPQQPDPEMLKLQAEQQMAQQAHQMEMQKQQLELQIQQQEAAAEARAREMEFALEQQRAQMEMRFEAQRQQQDLQFEQLMAAIKLQALQETNDAKLELLQEQARIKTQSDNRDSAAN